MRSGFFLAATSLLFTYEANYSCELKFEIPKLNPFKRSLKNQPTKKQKKARAKECKAKQARKINYQNQKKGIVNPNHHLSKTHKSWKDKL